ncbi:hypothetical protein [uncultured Zhongshania sp.]|tara:strand:- start:416 stop:544 length:129 start_codon:yes stop_codon:yes gene_type:complete
MAMTAVVTIPLLQGRSVFDMVFIGLGTIEMLVGLIESHMLIA